MTPSQQFNLFLVSLLNRACATAGDSVGHLRAFAGQSVLFICDEDRAPWQLPLVISDSGNFQLHPFLTLSVDQADASISFSSDQITWWLYTLTESPFDSKAQHLSPSHLAQQQFTPPHSAQFDSSPPNFQAQLRGNSALLQAVSQTLQAINFATLRHACTNWPRLTPPHLAPAAMLETLLHQTASHLVESSARTAVTLFLQTTAYFREEKQVLDNPDDFSKFHYRALDAVNAGGQQAIKLLDAVGQFAKRLTPKM